MNRGTPAGRPIARARGAALLVVLLMLVATWMLGISAARLSLVDGKALRNARDRELAFQAAEAGLTDAELDIAGSPDPMRSRSALFSNTSAAGFAVGCAAGENNIHLGLCADVVAGTPPAWLELDFLASGNDAHSVPYGKFTGRRMQTGAGALPARLPRYIIESLPYNPPGASASLSGLSYLYRITAIGFGPRESTRVVLQSFYRKEDGLNGRVPTSAPAAMPGTPLRAAALAEGQAFGAVAVQPESAALAPGPEREQGVQSGVDAKSDVSAEPDACRADKPAARKPPVAKASITVPGQTGHTLLLSGLADGAPGLEAHDAGDPDRLVFRFTGVDDAAIGTLSGAPAVGRFHAGSDSARTAYRDLAVVPGVGALFLLALDKDPLAPWELNRNYFKLSLPVNGEDAEEVEQRLAPPALLPGSDGTIRLAYAGDLRGRLWRFDFRADWAQGNAPAPFLLFAASDPQGEPQPITTRPALVFAPRGILALFGTGAPQAAAAIRSFYGIWDVPASRGRIGRHQLAPRSLSDAAGGRFVIAGPAFRYGLEEEERQGWYFDFPQSDRTGERSVTDPVTVDGRLFFNTWIPGTQACAAGQVRTYALETVTGLTLADQPTGAASAALRPAPLLLVRSILEVSAPDALGRQSARKKYTIPAAPGPPQPGMTAPASAPQFSWDWETPAGRLGWREIFNREELRQARPP
jgi:Tfp pilus assembly protein PilX